MGIRLACASRMAGCGYADQWPSFLLRISWAGPPRFFLPDMTSWEGRERQGPAVSSRFSGRPEPRVSALVCGALLHPKHSAQMVPCHHAQTSVSFFSLFGIPKPRWCCAPGDADCSLFVSSFLGAHHHCSFLRWKN